MNWGYYIVSTANTASEENGALIRSMKFSSGVASCLYKSTIQLYMEYCFHLAGATTRYFHMLDKLQKRVCSTLSTAFEPLGHRQTSLSLFCRYYFDRYSSELAELFHFLIPMGGPLLIIKMLMSTVSSLKQLDTGILCLQNAFL